MAKNKQDQTFEQTLKAQQKEMLDSEEEDFQCPEYSGDEDEDEEEFKSISSTDEEDEIDSDKEVEKISQKGEEPSTNSNLVSISSEDFKGIRDLDQLFTEGLPKSVLKKINFNIKYTTEELRKIYKNRNEEQWKDYFWKNHGDDWPVGDEPFEMDPELRVPYWKKLQILRMREEEAKRWQEIANPSNLTKQSAKKEKKEPKALSQQYKNDNAVQPDQSTSDLDFPYSSPPQIQAKWVMSQPLFHSYIDGMNKVIQELSGTTI